MIKTEIISSGTDHGEYCVRDQDNQVIVLALCHDFVARWLKTDWTSAPTKIRLLGSLSPFKGSRAVWVQHSTAYFNHICWWQGKRARRSLPEGHCMYTWLRDKVTELVKIGPDLPARRLYVAIEVVEV